LAVVDGDSNVYNMEWNSGTSEYEIIGRESDGTEIFTVSQDFATTVNSLAWDGAYLCVLGRE